ncbi:uncharacterized protein LOC117317954 [Pecten maximus]|uniref:uncharacterized protein LOC117317954 n=1 Tax=Pecten maximus TaxID=6579 RepID=UPI001458D6BD|nr:uncharacterized protein LOC117317954 [Pecten maximus]
MFSLVSAKHTSIVTLFLVLELFVMTEMATFMTGSVLKLVLATFLIRISSSVVLELTEITTPMSWNEAFYSGKCRIQSDVIGDLDFNKIRFNRPIDDVTEAWVGIFATSSVTLTFENCRLYREETLAGLKHFVFDHNTDILESCLHFCNSSRFGLSNDTCFCFEGNVPFYHPIILVDTEPWCLSDYDALCGSGPTQPHDTLILVICTYRPINISTGITGPGDCATYNKTNQRTKMVECDLKNDYVCKPDNQQATIPSETKRSWWEAAQKCTQQKSFFGNKTSVIGDAGSPGTSVDSYWINLFRRTSFSFIAPGEVEVGRCVAVRNNSGIFTLLVKECNVPLPVLCNSASTIVTTTDKSVTTSVKTDVSTSTHDVTADQTMAVDETKPVLWPLAFVALGIVIILVVSVILWRKNRESTRKMRTSKLMKHMSYGAAKPEHNYGFKMGNVLSYETSFIETEPNRVPAQTESLSVSSNIGTIENKQVNSSESPPDDIYNSLHEKKTDNQTDDVYDHTRDPNLGDDTYDSFLRSNALENNRTADCSEYDTMSNINAQSTGDSSIYDTCRKEHVAKPEVTGLDDYDSMININSA